MLPTFSTASFNFINFKSVVEAYKHLGKPSWFFLPGYPLWEDLSVAFNASRNSTFNVVF